MKLRGHPVGAYLLGAFTARPQSTARAVGWSAVAAVPAMAQGWAVARALDDGFLTGDAERGLLWLAIPAAGTVLAALGSARTVRAVGEVVEAFRDRLVDDLVTGVMDSAVTAAAGPATGAGTVARLVQQVEAMRLMLAASITTMLGIVTMLAAGLVGQSGLSRAALLLMLPPVVVCLGLFALTLPAVLARQRALVSGNVALSATLESDLAGLRDIRAAGAQRWARADCRRQIEAQRAAGAAAASITSVRLLTVELGGKAPAALLLLGSPWLLRHGVTAGTLAGSFTYALGTVSSAMHSISEALGSQVIPMWVTLENLLKEHLGRAPQPIPADSSCNCNRPAAVPVRVRGLRFAYGPTAEPVIHDLDLDLHAGEHVAIVGASGIGKSTLVNLVCGQLRPAAGWVRLGDRDPGLLSPAERAGLRTLIPQEAYVLTATLGANLRYLRPDAAPGDLDRAVEAIGMQELREQLGGYDGPVQPAALSAGERQLIALTRAWLSPAALIVLDEATCHLDPAAEARAEVAFAGRPGTLLVVAHRISSARRADRILVLDGTDAQIGTDQQLLARSPLYRDLVGHWEGDPVQPALPAPIPIPHFAPLPPIRTPARLGPAPWRVSL